jgi:hypothetical protein
VCDASAAQANVVGPNGDSCFFAHMRELAGFVSDDDAPQTPRNAAPKAALEGATTLIDNQLEEEDPKSPLRQDRDDAEEDEAELAGCRVTRSDEFSTPEEDSPGPVAVPAATERNPMTCAIS